MRVLITGGAGFIGANVAIGSPPAIRTGRSRLSTTSAGAVPSSTSRALRDAGVAFVHGDIRVLDDLLSIGELDALVECSAEPSALAGFDGSPDYVVKSNLVGAYNCLELARRRAAYVVFLSTSRVYPVGALRSLALVEDESRFEIAAEQRSPGSAARGPLRRSRSKALGRSTARRSSPPSCLIAEYRDAYGLRAVVDRCGVIAGPWQMGKVDQGVFTYWMLAHHFRRPLQLHRVRRRRQAGQGPPARRGSAALLEEQLASRPGGTERRSTSAAAAAAVFLCVETTLLCAELTGNRVDVGSVAQTRPGDVPIYISDCRRLFELTEWRPSKGPREILADIHAWIWEHETDLEERYERHRQASTPRANLAADANGDRHGLRWPHRL